MTQGTLKPANALAKGSEWVSVGEALHILKARLAVPAWGEMKKAIGRGDLRSRGMDGWHHKAFLPEWVGYLAKWLDQEKYPPLPSLPDGKGAPELPSDAWSDMPVRDKVWFDLAPKLKPEDRPPLSLANIVVNKSDIARLWPLRAKVPQLQTARPAQVAVNRAMLVAMSHAASAGRRLTQREAYSQCAAEFKDSKPCDAQMRQAFAAVPKAHKLGLGEKPK